MSVVGAAGVSLSPGAAGMSQPLSCGTPVASSAKWSSVKLRPTDAGVVATLREG